MNLVIGHCKTAAWSKSEYPSSSVQHHIMHLCAGSETIRAVFTSIADGPLLSPSWLKSCVVYKFDSVFF